jgi:CPA1 family monovalent cation:H+ antiporter
VPVTIELVITAFLAIILASQLLSQKLKVPYTLILVFVGIAIVTFSTFSAIGPGLISRAFQSVISQIRSFYTSMAQQGLFVGLIVPPLIFEAMIHIGRDELRSAIRPSLALATGGVVISTIVSGFTLWYLFGLSFAVSFLFAAIISPTDVVTVLEMFKRIRVPKRLAAIIDLEAALNDATAIVIFSIVLSSISLQRVPLLRTLVEFTLILAGGAAVGFFVAYAASIVNKYIEDSMAKTVLTVSAVYGSYVFASGLGASGLIAVAVVGLYFGNVVINTEKSEEAKRTILTFWQIAAFLGNSVAFLFIGFQTDLISLFGSLQLIIISYLAVLLARSFSVYPILGVLSQLGERIPISWSHTAMLSGVRGAISIALVSTVGISNVIGQSDYGTLTSMVLGVVFISIVMQVPVLMRYARKKVEEQNRLA